MPISLQTTSVSTIVTPLLSNPTKSFYVKDVTGQVPDLFSTQTISQACNGLQNPFTSQPEEKSLFLTINNSKVKTPLSVKMFLILKILTTMPC